MRRVLAALVAFVVGVQPGLLLAQSGGAAATAPSSQSKSTVASSPATLSSKPVPDIDAMGVSFDRIKRMLGDRPPSDDKQGLKLNYYVEVMGLAPAIQLFTPQDLAPTGRIPYAAPTHRDILDVLTPIQYRSPSIPVGSLAIAAIIKLAQWEANRVKRLKAEDERKLREDEERRRQKALEESGLVVIKPPWYTSAMRIHVAHSPDSDDAFMFFALAKGHVDTKGFEFVHMLSDIETLNRAAFAGKYEVTAISIHAYAHLHERYILLPHGASMGDNYGPVVVAKTDGPNSLDGVRVAVPGMLTTAYLGLKLYKPDVETVVMPFDQIQEAVARGDVAAGLLIHEGQLTYADEGLKKIVDLGEWWAAENEGLPLPLGGNVIRRDLGPETIKTVSALLHESIAYGLNHREEALDYAMQFGRGLDRAKADRFVGMYVNDLTLNYGDNGRKAVKLLLDRAHKAGIIPHAVTVEFAS
jgi:1,4-dihydroxy-6-naphthoate synthase